jgi:energy-coupling factor transporter ATP-binding protein EcfA2
MPGRHLNSKEKKLLEIWNHPPGVLTKPSLRSIEITGGTGLRGINALKINYRYPITAICGNNGSGKSTLLALTALAYHSPPGWFVYSGNTEPAQCGKDRTYYTFSTFFLNSPGEITPSEVSITWRYDKQGNEISRAFKKIGNRWGRYDTRPEREIYYLPLGRILPANELTGVRALFHNPIGQIERTPLNIEYIGYLSFIMGRQYTQAEVQTSNKYKFQSCTFDVPYTAFNMGGGESCMITLLHLLQNLPVGGMIVIEEIEAGLHPQAQIRLTRQLLDICKKKMLQVVCSTHSQVIIDSLPREARILVKQSGNDHQIIESPSTRFAMYHMTGENNPELTIYCEDDVAACMIEESLPHEIRVRISIRVIGSNTFIAHQGVSHLRSGFNMKALCVFDGDCGEQTIKGWITDEGGTTPSTIPEYLLLPGDKLPPEKWAVLQLSHSPYKENFARELSCPIATAQEHIQALGVILEHHDIPFTLSQRTGLDIPDCTKRIMRAFALQHPQLNELRVKVKSLLG